MIVLETISTCLNTIIITVYSLRWDCLHDPRLTIKLQLPWKTYTTTSTHFTSPQPLQVPHCCVASLVDRIARSLCLCICVCLHLCLHPSLALSCFAVHRLFPYRKSRARTSLCRHSNCYSIGFQQIVPLLSRLVAASSTGTAYTPESVAFTSGVAPRA